MATICNNDLRSFEYKNNVFCVFIKTNAYCIGKALMGKAKAQGLGFDFREIFRKKLSFTVSL